MADVEPKNGELQTGGQQSGDGDVGAVRLDYLPRLPRKTDVRIGCIGAGFIMADCHLPAYRAAGLNPVAIAARRRGAAAEVAARHSIGQVYDSYEQLLAEADVDVVDVAVPPDKQIDVIRALCARPGSIRGVLAQKPLGIDYAQAAEIVRLCREVGLTLVVNQNMRFDQSVRACQSLISQGVLGKPVLATIDMRAIPHWMPWQERLGWVTLRIMSIHHLDTFRFWFGTPRRIFASTRPDPRTRRKFAHRDGICLYIVEYDNDLRAMGCDDVWTGPAREGAAADIGIRYRVEGELGLARGTIGWPSYPERTPSTLDYTLAPPANADPGAANAAKIVPGVWHRPRWNEVWFPDAFVGPMAQLLCALEDGVPPEMSGEDNLQTMALVEAAYRSAKEHRAVEITEITG